MGYLICDKCGGYYELKEGESPNDFDLCNCGGKLRYANSLYGKSHESKKSENKIKERILGFWNKQNRSGKIVLILLGLFFVIASTFGVLGKIYPDTSTPQGYLAYHNTKMEESLGITQDVADVLRKYNNNLISSDNAVETLNNDKQKMDKLIQDFQSINVPPQYKKHRELVVSAFKDLSNAISELTVAIKNRDQSAINAAIESMKSSIDNVKQSENEIKRINNIN